MSFTLYNLISLRAILFKPKVKLFPPRNERSGELQEELFRMIARPWGDPPVSGHRHATISLICMSTHKAMAARCLSYHQAAYGQPAIWALATAPLRRLALSVLFTIATNSYQTTCTISERTFNKRQNGNARHGVDFSLFTHYDMVAAWT